MLEHMPVSTFRQPKNPSGTIQAQGNPSPNTPGRATCEELEQSISTNKLEFKGSKNLPRVNKVEFADGGSPSKDSVDKDKILKVIQERNLRPWTKMVPLRF